MECGLAILMELFTMCREIDLNIISIVSNKAYDLKPFVLTELINISEEKQNRAAISVIAEITIAKTSYHSEKRKV